MIQRGFITYNNLVSYLVLLSATTQWVSVQSENQYGGIIYRFFLFAFLFLSLSPGGKLCSRRKEESCEKTDR